MTTKPKLTKKQRGFVRDYVETGNGTQAALKNYDIQSSKPEKVASVIATENLSKPSIIKAIESIAERIPDELLVEKHLELLNASQVQHASFPLNPEDEDNKELEAMFTRSNCKVYKIINTTASREVYFFARDNASISKALDLAYKIKGTYAPEQKEVRMVGLIAIQDATKKILES